MRLAGRCRSLPSFRSSSSVGTAGYLPSEPPFGTLQPFSSGMACLQAMSSQHGLRATRATRTPKLALKPRPTPSSVRENSDLTAKAVWASAIRFAVKSEDSRPACLGGRRIPSDKRRPIKNVRRSHFSAPRASCRRHPRSTQTQAGTNVRTTISGSDALRITGTPRPNYRSLPASR
jgi:hypothetical protein